jgi:hypothetical protein
MSVPSDRDVYASRCLRVAAAAGAAGLTMRKLKQPALEVARGGKAVAFPIVTDARTWRDTSVEEAFYVVLVDARSWSMASETISKASVVASLEDEVEKAEIPRVRQDLGDELERVKNLTEMLGGEDELNSLYATAELI